MKTVIKGIISGVLIILAIVIAFIAGDFLHPNIVSVLGFNSKPLISEPISDSQPHTADEVTNVEIIRAIDNSGSGTAEITQQRVPYAVEVDFQPVLMEEGQLEKKLLIMTQKATAPQTAKKEGLFDLPIFNQTKVVIYHGEGSYFVDLSSLKSSDFEIDNDQKRITISIPKPVLSVQLLTEETEFFDTSNGKFRFGDMELTPETSTTLQLQGIERITEILESDRSTWDTVIRYAKLSVKEIYEPLVKAQVDDAVKNAEDEYAIPVYYTISVKVKE